MQNPTTIKEIMDRRPNLLTGAFFIYILRIVSIILNILLLLAAIILFVNSKIIATDFVSAQLKMESSTDTINLSDLLLKYASYVFASLALLMGTIAWLCKKLLQRHYFAVELEEYINRKKEERAAKTVAPNSSIPNTN